MKWCGKNVLVRRRQYAIPNACTGAIQYGYADACGPISTAGNVLFIAATADNYCALTT